MGDVVGLTDIVTVVIRSHGRGEGGDGGDGGGWM
jgi:hypothetical protein